MKGIAIIVAAGSGSRAGVDKIWEKMGGETVLMRSVRPFLSCPAIEEIIVVVREEKKSLAQGTFKGLPVSVVVGGETRSESVRNALRYAVERFGEKDVIVAIHDGARPYVKEDLITRCMARAAKEGSAVPALPCSDSLRKITEEGNKAVDRREYVSVQTPQCFDLGRIQEAYRRVTEASDDATIYEAAFGSVALEEGDPKNKKITYLSDIYEYFSRRVGVGFDVHELREGRRLVLGGVTIPHEKGLYGHSDADVLTHAVMDALLTAADLPDIGHFFPPEDPKYEGADSLTLLAEVLRAIRTKGYDVENISATIMAEKPKLAPYLPEMEEKIAGAIGKPKERVRFAATTTEKLGIIGEEKGMAADAVALLVRSDELATEG
ncbi:MAG: 2-C-methyl-D-erythritol 2,4-cyclodiphosphate synthase [Clostridia bacterium]|nr:2-C-methyl-D-erythritol 2,4-cyclodiphosphate synthase [Clostridia bacterium]